MKIDLQTKLLLLTLKNLKTALKHVTIRLMSSWQRLRGSGVGPESGPLDHRAWAPPRLRINDPSKSNSLFRTLTRPTVCQLVSHTVSVVSYRIVFCRWQSLCIGYRLLLIVVQHEMKYKLLVRNCLLTYGLLCLGVYRLVDDVVDDRPNEVKGQRTLTQKRYVITHPPTDFRLIDSDRVSLTYVFLSTAWFFNAQWGTKCAVINWKCAVTKGCLCSDKTIYQCMKMFKFKDLQNTMSFYGHCSFTYLWNMHLKQLLDGIHN